MNACKIDTNDSIKFIYFHICSSIFVFPFSLNKEIDPFLVFVIVNTNYPSSN